MTKVLPMTGRPFMSQHLCSLTSSPSTAFYSAPTSLVSSSVLRSTRHILTQCLCTGFPLCPEHFLQTSASLAPSSPLGFYSNISSAGNRTLNHLIENHQPPPYPASYTDAHPSTHAAFCRSKALLYSSIWLWVESHHQRDVKDLILSICEGNFFGKRVFADDRVKKKRSLGWAFIQYGLCPY